MKAKRIMGYRQANRMHLGEVAAVKLLIYHHYRSTSTLTHGRYLSEVRRTLYTTHPTLRFRGVYHSISPPVIPSGYEVVREVPLILGLDAKRRDALTINEDINGRTSRASLRSERIQSQS